MARDVGAGDIAGQPTSIRTVQALLTASEAFPAFERLFLNARDRISLGMRIFDPRTRLHSPEARRVGEDWFDLVVHTLRRGVRLTIVLSDFDPIVRPDYHQRATRCLRMLIAAGEVSGRRELLSVRSSMHPARVGWLPSLALWPRARGRLKDTVSALNEQAPEARRRRLRELPMLRPYLDVRDDDVRLRPLVLPRLTPVTHHQKLAVADGETLYIGGLDLNDRRFDTPDHDRPANETWHDTQLLIRGDIAAEAEAHLQSFEKVVDGGPAPKLNGLMRTLSSRREFEAVYLSPRPVLAEIGTAHLLHVREARQLIYLETQFLRDRAFARRLVRVARARPDLQLILILPAAPDDVAFAGNTGSDARYGEFLQARCVKMVREAFGSRVFIGSPAQRRPASGRSRSTAYGAPIVYLHAKVSIFDWKTAIVSSANLNGRSFRWDTEAGVTLTDPEQVQDLGRRCLSHWLAGDVPDAFRNPETAVEAWRNQARDNVRRAPADRQGYILPYSSAPARRFGRDLPGIPEEMV